MAGKISELTLTAPSAFDELEYRRGSDNFSTTASGVALLAGLSMIPLQAAYYVTGTSPQAYGPAVSGTGTATAVARSSTTPASVNVATAATANATASRRAEMTPAAFGTNFPGFYGTVSFNLPDANYGSGSTGARIVAGIFHNETNWHTTDNGSGSDGGAVLSYSTNRGGNWQIVTNNGSGGVTVTDTGVAFAVGTWHFETWRLPGSSDLNWRLSDGTTSAGGSVSTNILPNYSYAPFWGASLATLTTTARNLRVLNISFGRIIPGS